MEMLDSLIRALQAGPDLPPPVIESVSDPDSILGMLPKDRAGAVDWVAASAEGVIRPRASAPDMKVDSARVFPFDFYIDGDGGPEAFFPHSIHQEWVGCSSCHPGIYRRTGADLPPSQVHGDASCGVCHARVAFPIASCERCHKAATDLPAGRLDPSLGDPVRLSRSLEGFPENSDAETFGEYAQAYPPAVFAHAPHRIRYQCRACHDSPFAMAEGATRLSSDQAHGSAACGSCHNGVVAFDAGGDQCARCHVPETGGIQGGE